MLIYEDLRLTIAFGDQETSFPPRAFYGIGSDYELLAQPQFADTAGRMGLRRLIVLNQTHSDRGYVIDEQALARYKPYAWEGDYLLTNLSGIGLGVATADCLPIVIYDPTHHALGVAHAGWVGSFKGIAVMLLEDMQKQYSTAPADVQVFFGSSSHACCYEVQRGFVEKLTAFDYGRQALEERSGRFYFDLPRFNQLQLEAAGMQTHALSAQYGFCTICFKRLCSHRRDGDRSRRQITVASIKIPH